MCFHVFVCRAPASKWSPRPPGPTPPTAPARASPRPSNDGGRISPRPSNVGGRASPAGGRVSPIGGRVSPIGGRVSPVGAGNYQSAAKVVADAHAAQVQRQKALAAQQAQRQQARAKLEEEKKQLALVSTLSQNVHACQARAPLHCLAIMSECNCVYHLCRKDIAYSHNPAFGICQDCETKEGVKKPTMIHLHVDDAKKNVP